MKTFDHKFTSDSNISELFAYSKALNHVFLHIKEAKGGTNQFIDAIPLIDKIAATNAELMQLANEYEAKLDLIGHKK